MKKFILSFFLIFSFTIYAIYQRSGGFAERTVYVAPIATSQTNNQKASPALSAPMMDMTGMGMMNHGLYRNGQYTGNSADAYYGNVQVKAIISGGKINDVQFLDYPQDRRNSIDINSYAMPRLTSEAITVQNAEVDTISGATETSRAFRESLASALAEAKN